MGICHDASFDEIDKHVGQDARMDAQFTVSEERTPNGYRKAADTKLYGGFVRHDAGDVLGHGQLDNRRFRIGHQDLIAISRDEEVNVCCLDQRILPS